jgi:aryl-alcohol dehydrogenase-like predicted oxidoreductase
MIGLHELSRIGFGGYRISAQSKTHYDALVYALSCGCNLIDTSANYNNGDSEKLIGIILKEHPHVDAFVITKGGYIQGDNLHVFRELNQRGLAQDGLRALPDNTQYSLHPDLLKSQIELSYSRLQGGQIDGYLLHNPEHYFDDEEHPTSQNEYYGRIAEAFELLETKVSEGQIRYYGVSSNTLPFSTERHSTTNLHKLLAIAEKISSNHHFKLVQFPFNCIE